MSSWRLNNNLLMMGSWLFLISESMTTRVKIFARGRPNGPEIYLWARGEEVNYYLNIPGNWGLTLWQYNSRYNQITDLIKTNPPLLALGYIVIMKSWNISMLMEDETLFILKMSAIRTHTVWALWERMRRMHAVKQGRMSIRRECWWKDIC